MTNIQPKEITAKQNAEKIKQTATPTADTRRRKAVAFEATPIELNHWESTDTDAFADEVATFTEDKLRGIAVGLADKLKALTTARKAPLVKSVSIRAGVSNWFREWQGMLADASAVDTQTEAYAVKQYSADKMRRGLNSLHLPLLFVVEYTKASPLASDEPIKQAVQSHFHEVVYGLVRDIQFQQLPLVCTDDVPKGVKYKSEDEFIDAVEFAGVATYSQAVVAFGAKVTSRHKARLSAYLADRQIRVKAKGEKYITTHGRETFLVCYKDTATSAGKGKSWLANALAEALQLPTDRGVLSYAESRDVVGKLTGKPCFILDEYRVRNMPFTTFLACFEPFACPMIDSRNTDKQNAAAVNFITTPYSYADFRQHVMEATPTGESPNQVLRRISWVLEITDKTAKGVTFRAYQKQELADGNYTHTLTADGLFTPWGGVPNGVITALDLQRLRGLQY